MSARYPHHKDVRFWLDWRNAADPDAPVLLALHGIGSRPEAWTRLAAHLPGWRIIAWEAPGYGHSQPMGIDWPLAVDYADSVDALLCTVNLMQVHVVGHSLGTLVGAALAVKYPETILSLTLASCAQGGGIAPGAPLPPAHQARIDDLTRLGAKAFAAARTPRLLHNAPPDLIAEAEAAMASVTLPGYAQAVRMLASGDLAADCARITAPTAVIVGAEDLVTPPAQSARAYAALPRPRAFVTVPGCGHALPLQAPQALAALIQSGATP